VITTALKAMSGAAAANPFKEGVAEEYGQALGDDFLPDRELLEINTHDRITSSISIKSG
jgi:hypothetical protein